MRASAVRAPGSALRISSSSHRRRPCVRPARAGGSHNALRDAFTTEHTERTKAEAAEAAARAAAIDQVRLTNITQLLGLSRITFDKQPGQIVLSVGPDNTIPLICVELTQPYRANLKCQIGTSSGQTGLRFQFATSKGATV